MKNLITPLVVLISMLTNSYSQDNIIKCDDEIEYTNAKYIGCVDVENRPDGFMKKFKNVYWSLNDDQLILFK